LGLWIYQNNATIDFSQDPFGVNPLKTWQHFAISRKNRVFYVFLDGVLKFAAENALGNYTNNASLSALYIGNNGVNNPCPTGFHVPNQADLQAEIAKWQSLGKTPFEYMYLTVSGQRLYNDGNLQYVGTRGYYWISPGQSGTTNFLVLYSNNTTNNVGNNALRGNGMAVRCIKNY
jgi:hypothetical protein